MTKTVLHRSTPRPARALDEEETRPEVLVACGSENVDRSHARKDRYDAQSSGIDGMLCPRCFADGFRGAMELRSDEVAHVQAQAQQEGVNYKREVWRQYGTHWLRWRQEIFGVAELMTPDQVVKKNALLVAQANYQNAVKACPTCSRQGRIAHNHDADCGHCDLKYGIMMETQRAWDAVKPR